VSNMELPLNFPELICHDGQLLIAELDGHWQFREPAADAKKKLSLYDPALVQLVHLPTKSFIASNLSGSAILEMVESYLEAIVRFPAPDYTVLGAFIVSTYFADALPIVPSLAITTPNPEQAFAAFNAIASICRHSLIVDSSIRIADIPLFLDPTLAIDATALTERHVNQLCPISSRLIARMVGARIESVAVPRVILAREPVRNASICLAINSAAAVNSCYPSAQRVYDHLSGYRLHKHSAVSQLTSSGNLLVDLLLRCFPDDDSARQKITEAVTIVNSLQVSSCIAESNEENFLLQALHAAVHKESRIRILELAELATAIFEVQGFNWQVSAKAVAAFLRRNGLCPRHARVGLVLEVDQRTKLIVHRLCKEVLRLESQRFSECPMCEEGVQPNVHVQ
jgi:hypothetical protein